VGFSRAGQVDLRSTCTARLVVNVPEGFALERPNVELRGSALTGDAASARVVLRVRFAGELDRGKLLTIEGGHEGAYTVESSPGDEPVSPCGGEAVLETALAFELEGPTGTATVDAQELVLAPLQLRACTP
jgi:hypothetical protein